MKPTLEIGGLDLTSEQATKLQALRTKLEIASKERIKCPSVHRIAYYNFHTYLDDLEEQISFGNPI